MKKRLSFILSILILVGCITAFVAPKYIFFKLSEKPIASDSDLKNCDNNASISAEDDSPGRALQKNFIWLDSAPFGKEVYVVFRKQWKIIDRPEKAILNIFADTRYMLWINGQYVERGPCRFVPSHPEYDTVDITMHLHQGENTIAVLVHHYHDGVFKNDGSEVNGRVARHVPGLTVKLDITARNGQQTSLSTDTTWRGSAKNRFGASGVASSSIPDHIDARLDSGDWTVAGFDDSGWEKPVPVDGRKWGPLLPRGIPRLRETEIMPLTLIWQSGIEVSKPLAETLPIEMNSGEQLVIDAGQFVQAYSIIDLEAQMGSELEIEYAQRFFDTGHQPGQSHGHVNRYIARAGKQTYLSGDTYGCKYVVLRLKSGRLSLLGMHLVNRLYPFQIAGQFQSNDNFLNQLWQIGINTALLCSEDAYVDCAGRERAAWLGDMVVVTAPVTRIGLAGPGVGGSLRYADPRLFRRGLNLVGNNVLPDGRVKAFAPSDGFDIHGYIEDYACLWIQGIHTYYNMTGDLDLVKQLWTTVTQQLKWFQDRLSPNGLVNAREFVFFDNPLVYQVCEGATLNAYLYRTLLDAAEMAKWLGKPEQQQQYQTAAKTLKEAINAYLWDNEAGAYYGGIKDGQRTKLTAYAAMMCLYFDVVPTERKERVNQWLLANYEKDVWSPYASMFLFEVFYRMNTPLADLLVMNLMRQNWAEMVKGETHTAWEGFSRLAEPCHIMGSTPTYFLSRYVLGVGVDGPVRNGRIVIEPRLGDLLRAKGNVVTEFGMVTVLWEKTDNGKKLVFQLDIPEKATAEIHLPRIGDSQIVLIDGQVTKPVAHGRFLKLELKPGKHVGVLK